MGKHRVDLAGIRCEVSIAGRLILAVAVDLGKQLLEVSNIAIDGCPEVAVAQILPFNLVERLLPLERV